MAALLYELIMASVLSLAGMCSAFLFAGKETLPWEYYLSAVLFSLVTVLLRRLKTRGRLILSGICISLLAGVILSVPAEQRLLFLRSHVHILWILLGCIACVLLEQYAQRHFPVRLIPSAAGIAVLVWIIAQDLKTGKHAVLFILLYLLLVTAEFIQRSWKREGRIHTRAHIAHAFPVIAVPIVLLCFITFPQEPYQWTFVRNLMENVRSQYEVLRQALNLKRSWDHSEAEVGFSEEAEFFGNLNESAYEALRITTVGVSPGTRIYLSGRSFDSFDGRSWQKTDTSEENYRMYDLVETLSAVLGYDRDHLRDYIRTSGLEIDFRGIRTDHVFMPAKTLPQVRDSDTRQEGGDFWFNDRGSDEYSVDYCRLNRRYEKFEALAANPPEGLPSMDAADALPGLDITGYTGQAFLRYRRRMREIYCPKTEISQRTRDCLNEVLKDTSGDYEKLLAIERMLNEMTYTTSPGELPAYVNSPASFLDYLLFESQEGYCTHYATAFVLLARAEGIPARYQQGYCFSAEEKETKVLSKHAHAWAEAYIEGIGWLEFEPSRGFRHSAGWKVTVRSEETDSNIVSMIETEEEEEEEETAASSDAAVNAQETETSGRPYLPFVLAGLFVLACIPLDYLFRRIRYRTMKDREKIRILMRRNLRILRRMGLRPDPGETLKEFHDRACRTIPEKYLSFLQVYEEILYKERDVSAADISLFETSVQDLRRLFVEKLTKRRNRSEE